VQPGRRAGLAINTWLRDLAQRKTFATLLASLEASRHLHARICAENLKLNLR
jgi:hypothetical protein